MVFNAKTANTPHRMGDMQTVRRFAWFPHRIKDEYVWLETYETLQYYQLVQYPIVGEQQKFIDVYRWIDIADKRILPKVQIEQ